MQAVEAYLNSASAPIGAVVVDDLGQVVARGGNGFAHGRLAHAELAALSAIPRQTNRSRCEIYCTLEACLMCTGAIRLCQLHAVHCAAVDPAAGGTAFLGANEFMRQFPCSVYVAGIPELEFVVVTLVAEFRHRNGHGRWREHWARYHPRGVEVGASLATVNTYRDWASSHISAEQLYEQLALLQRAA
jgi:tRNA(adenine34) deaminase